MGTLIQDGNTATDIEDLKAIRDRYHNGSWNAMVRHYKIQTKQRNMPVQLKEQLERDIETIKTHIGQNPEEGFKDYEGVKFRLPANVCAKDIEAHLKEHEGKLPKLAEICTREVLFVLTQEERKKS